LNKTTNLFLPLKRQPLKQVLLRHSVKERKIFTEKSLSLRREKKKRND
jgi:hypothetical protein